MNYTYFDIPFYSDSKQAFEAGDDLKISNNNVFIIKESDHSESNITFLSKILKAIQLDLNANASLVILKNDHKGSLMEYLDSNREYNIVTFGINAISLNLQINTFLYKKVPIQNINLLFAHSLQDLQNDVPKKKKLWSELQELFK